MKIISEVKMMMMIKAKYDYSNDILKCILITFILDLEDIMYFIYLFQKTNTQCMICFQHNLENYKILKDVT